VLARRFSDRRRVLLDVTSNEGSTCANAYNDPLSGQAVIRYFETVVSIGLGREQPPRASTAPTLSSTSKRVSYDPALGARILHRRAHGETGLRCCTCSHWARGAFHEPWPRLRVRTPPSIKVQPSAPNGLKLGRQPRQPPAELWVAVVSSTTQIWLKP
jgi:hypothetical protein